MKYKFVFKSFKTRLAFWLIAVPALPLIAVGLIISQEINQAVKEEAFTKLTAIRDLKAEQVEAWIEKRERDLRIISENPDIRRVNETYNKKKCSPSDLAIQRNTLLLLNRFIENNTTYHEIFIVRADSGKIVISTDNAAAGKDKSSDPYFTTPMRTGRSFIKDVYYSKTLRMPSMAFAHPIFGTGDRKNSVVGIVVARIDLQASLYKLLQDRTGMGYSGETLLVNKDQIAISDLRWHDNATLNLKILAKPVVMASQGNADIVEAHDYRDEKVLAAYTHIPKTQWGFVAKQDLKEVYSPIRAMFKNIILFCAFSIAMVYLIAALVSRRVAQPLIAMTKVAQELKKGNLTARNEVTTRDESGILAESFNDMAESITSNIMIQEGVSEIMEAIVGIHDIHEFRTRLTQKLIEVTNSVSGAYYYFDKETNLLKHATSTGLNRDLFDSFDASILEGELGQALKTKKIAYISDIPEDSLFTFKTFVGTVLPKEIITIPLVVDHSVVSLISLANLHRSSNEKRAILDQVWHVMNAGLAILIANEKTRELAHELEKHNQMLQAQSEELHRQTHELRQQSDELQKQNVELEAQRKEVEKANRLKSEFLSNMSHELRTPLNSVIALSRVLVMQCRKKLSEEELGYLEIIGRNGKNLLSLINDILDLSKIESGHMDVNPKLFSISSAIEVIMERIQPLAEEKRIQLKTQLPDHLPPIESDEVRVHQMLQNLIGNAVKFTHEGSVTVTAAVDNQKLFIRVKDTGIGIDKKNLSRIFKEFSQVDGSASRQYEGTGLGLAITRKAARMLKGKVSVKSTPGAGSTFSLVLPLVWSAAEAEHRRVESDPPLNPHSTGKPVENDDAPGKTSLISDEFTEKGAGTNGTNPLEPLHKSGSRILMVEDNEVAIIQVKKALEQEGYAVDIARRGQEALDYMTKKIPDCIILDLMMPGTDGFEVLEQMRATKETATIPVLILTAKDLTPDDFKKLSANNIQQLIQKGDVDEEGLLFRIKLMLGNKSESRGKVSDTIAGREPIPPSVKKKTAPLKAIKPSDSPRILIVEDNPDNMVTIKAVLGNQYRIMEAVDGEEGLELVLDQRPDLVLLDMALPQMDGFAVVRKIKADRRVSNTPVIALTARAMKGDREKTITAGCDDYIVKPIDPDTIRIKIDALLNQTEA